MYCAVDEAFDNPIKQQMQQMERENNVNKYRASLEKGVENNQTKYGLYPPHTTEGYETIKQPDNVYPNNNVPFFTAQGDLNKNGTSISSLRNQEKREKDDYSYLDSNYSELLSSESEEMKPSKSKFNHRYYINKFIKSIIDDGNDTISLASSQDDELYDHIKVCKYCRNQINLRMKNFYRESVKENKTESVNIKKTIEEFKLPETVFGYSMKEILLIIVASVVIIFILDLLVRIGRKTIKD